MFNLPKSTIVQKVIPKNAFDEYTNSKQKKLIKDKISRITWSNKISFDTTNLKDITVEEIQLFEIDLKEESDIQSILAIIDKSIPYNIIFVMRFSGLFYLSTSAKHINPHNSDKAVVDYTFKSGWISNDENFFRINLKNNLDWVYKDFCEQFKNYSVKADSLEELVSYNKEKDFLKKEIMKIEAAILGCKQFNKKVELNLKLKELEERLSNLL